MEDFSTLIYIIFGLLAIFGGSIGKWQKNARKKKIEDAYRKLLEKAKTARSAMESTVSSYETHSAGGKDIIVLGEENTQTASRYFTYDDLVTEGASSSEGFISSFGTIEMAPPSSIASVQNQSQGTGIRLTPENIREAFILGEVLQRKYS